MLHIAPAGSAKDRSPECHEQLVQRRRIVASYATARGLMRRASSIASSGEAKASSAR
jgi:hypothetical protein